MNRFWFPELELNKREVTCLALAAVLHSLLFLWKGGMLELPDQEKLGDMVVQVQFMNDMPDYDMPGAGGGGAPQSTGLLDKMKSLFKGKGGSAPEISKGVDIKVDTGQTFTKVGDQLTNKTFDDVKGFQGLANTTDNVDIAKGSNKEIINKPSQGNFEPAPANLKESKFKLAMKDAPFAVTKPKNFDSLSNANAVPVAIGNATSQNIKSLSGGVGAGPALQSKTVASKGFNQTGFSGGASSGGNGSGAGSSLSMGAGNAFGGVATGGGSGAGSGMGSGSGVGNGGSGSGTGGGSGSGTGTGYGSGSGAGSGGKAYGGGGSRGLMSLPRNEVASSDLATGSGNASSGKSGSTNRDSRFAISGALANRPVQSKVFATYERDGRVSLRFKVDWRGRVLEGIVVEVSSGSPSFDQKVVTSLKQWLFNSLPTSRSNEIQEGVITFVFRGV
ncbi:MAG: energy transducer TonB [Elusimicrobiota bacterium]